MPVRRGPSSNLRSRIWSRNSAPIRALRGCWQHVHGQRPTDHGGLPWGGEELPRGRAPPGGAEREARGDVVTAKELVPTLPVEQHDHACLARGLHHTPLRVDAERADRLLVVHDKLLYVVQGLLCRRLDSVVLDYVGPLGNLLGVTPLVIGEARKPSSERVTSVVAGNFGAQRDDRGRVDPAAERRPDRHVAT